MLIWFAIFLYALLLLALVYVWIDIIRLFISRRYRQCPPLVPSFGRQKKVMIEKISAELKQNRQPLNVLDPGCGTGTLLLWPANFPTIISPALSGTALPRQLPRSAPANSKTSESCGRTCSTFLLPNLTLLPVF